MRFLVSLKLFLHHYQQQFNILRFTSVYQSHWRHLKSKSPLKELSISPFQIFLRFFKACILFQKSINMLVFLYQTHNFLKGNHYLLQSPFFQLVQLINQDHSLHKELLRKVRRNQHFFQIFSLCFLLVKFHLKQ